MEKQGKRNSWGGRRGHETERKVTELESKGGVVNGGEEGMKK